MGNKHYVVYGDGSDYIVVDGIWDDLNYAAGRVAFLNSLQDDHCKGYLCLDWTVEAITLKHKDDINLIPDHESGWFLK